MATLRVLGFQRMTITQLMIAESVLVGLLGAVIAVVVITIGDDEQGLAIAPLEIDGRRAPGPESHGAMGRHSSAVRAGIKRSKGT